MLEISTNNIDQDPGREHTAAAIAQQLEVGLAELPDRGPDVSEWGMGMSSNLGERQKLADEMYADGKKIASEIQEALIAISRGQEMNADAFDPAVASLAEGILSFATNPTDERIVLASSDKLGDDKISDLIFPDGYTNMTGAAHRAKALLDSFRGEPLPIKKGGRGHKFMRVNLENGVALTCIVAPDGTSTLEIGKIPE